LAGHDAGHAFPRALFAYVSRVSGWHKTTEFEQVCESIAARAAQRSIH
jgi:hypothetical protein